MPKRHGGFATSPSPEPPPVFKDSFHGSEFLHAQPNGQDEFRMTDASPGAFHPGGKLAPKTNALPSPPAQKGNLASS